MRFLKQSTQVVEMLGPFLDKTDGVSEEAGLAGAGTEISKAGAAFGAGPVLGTYDSDGYYPVTLTTTHTNTLGSFFVKVNDAATHLPVWHEFMVVPANVWDSMFGASLLKVDVDTIKTNPVVNGGTITFPTNKTLADSVAVAAVQTDVTTLLGRITAALFSGITSLAQWLGLMAGKQAADATALTEIKATGAGAGTYAATTDSLEAMRDRGDAAWITATGFSTHSAADVWAVATRVLTAGTNIVLAKGTGVTGFNDLSAAQVNAEADTAISDAALATAAALASVAASAKNRVQKNAALAGFVFFMRDSTTHAAATGLTITAERTIDGAALGACANAVSEISNGLYKIDLAAADLNGNVIALRFTAVGADDLIVPLVTQPN